MIKSATAASTMSCPVGMVMGLRERKKLEAWRTIRSTALRLISERGFDAVSVEYFASKEAVIFDLDRDERQRWRDILADPRDGQPLWAALTDVALELTQLLSE